MENAANVDIESRMDNNLLGRIPKCTALTHYQARM